MTGENTAATPNGNPEAAVVDGAGAGVVVCVGACGADGVDAVWGAPPARGAAADGTEPVAEGIPACGCDAGGAPVDAVGVADGAGAAPPGWDMYK